MTELRRVLQDIFDVELAGLFEGYGGLSMAVQQVLGVRLGWYCEYEPPTEKNPRPANAAARLLAHHYPDLPNFGDVTQVDWATVPRPRILTGGFPCQDVSAAGKRAGLNPDSRSGLWVHMAKAIDVLRPELVVIENVRGLLSAHADSAMEPCPWCLGNGPDSGLRALGAVLGDLVDLGYDARWCGLPAAGVGAPHERFRIFVLAWPAADADGSGRERPSHEGWGAGGGVAAAGGGAEPVADADGGGVREQPVAVCWSCGAPQPQQYGDGGAAADPERVRLGARRPAGPGEAEGRRARGDVAGRDVDAAADTDVAQRDGDRPAGPAGEEGPGSADDRGGAVAADADGAGRDAGEGLHRAGGAAAVGDGASACGFCGHEHDLHDAGGFCVGCPSETNCYWGNPLAAEAEGDGRGEGWPEPAGVVGGSDAAVGGAVPDWGIYTAAIRRWERALGRVAPAPTLPGRRGGQQLSPFFVEWMQGLDEGHVTGVPRLTRGDQLKILGNGVVPQQAAAALEFLLAS